MRRNSLINAKMTATQPIHDDDKDDLIKGKADMKDLLAIGEMKSNKFDTEILMRCVDIQHKQILQIVVLITEGMKTQIKNAKESESSI